MDAEEIIVGQQCRVRVITNPKGMRQFVGIVLELHFDLGRYCWRSEGALHSYTTKIERKMQNARALLLKSIPDK